MESKYQLILKSKFSFYRFMKQETNPQQQNTPAQNQQGNKQKRKMTNQQYKKQAEQNKKKWMPLVRYMKKHTLKFKTARCGRVRVQYFRTDEFQQLIQKNKQEIQKNQTLKDLVFHWQQNVIYLQRPQNLPKLKYPKQLVKSQGNSKAKFATFKFDPAQQKTWLFPTILLGILAVVLFPLWPYSLKYAVFMICLVLVITILSLIVLRLIIYLIFAIFGMSFWILPNFFADCTILESFQPIYSVTKWESGFFSIIGRIVALSIVSYYAYHVYVDQSWIFENIQITKTSLDDLHNWGVSKIKGEKNFSQSALTNLDHIMNQTADIHVDQSLDLENQQTNTQQTENNDNSAQENQDKTNNEDTQDEQEIKQEQVDPTL